MTDEDSKRRRKWDDVNKSLNYFYFLILLVALPLRADPRDTFLQTLGENRRLLQDLSSESAMQRRQAATFMEESDAYSTHIDNYLAYVNSLGDSHDVFKTLLPRRAIKCLGHSNQKLYLQVMQKLFGRGLISGDDFLYFYTRPDLFFNPVAAKKLIIRKDLTFYKLFHLMQSLLPANFPYKTTLKIEPGVVGGNYDPQTDTIIFGDYSPNISTVMGFIHEFGHSIFRFDTNDETLGRYVGGFNEAYAELWAIQVDRFPFLSEIFEINDPDVLKAYLDFRGLLGQQFYLMALELERLAAKKPMGAESYQLAQKIAGQNFLRVDRLPALLPISADQPGDLPLYLIIPFVGAHYKSHVRNNHLVEDLLAIGAQIKGDGTLDHFTSQLDSWGNQYLANRGCLSAEALMSNRKSAN